MTSRTSRSMMQATQKGQPFDPAGANALQAMFNLLTFFAERSEVPASFLLLSMTSALTAHWATGQSATEDGHLAALLAAWGAVLGLAGAYALGRGAESLLFEMQGNDPIVFAVATSLLGLVALGAGFLPAQKAAHTDPMVALRNE